MKMKLLIFLLLTTGLIIVSKPSKSQIISPFNIISGVYEIDANGQLTVSAQQTTTGTASTIEITPAYGLSDEQKEQLLISGFKYAEEDKNARSLIETKVEAEREVLALQSALTEFASLLNTDEQQALATKIHALEVALSTNDLAHIDAHKAQLKPLSDDFASRIMNQSVKISMAGTSAKDW